MDKSSKKSKNDKNGPSKKTSKEEIQYVAKKSSNPDRDDRGEKSQNKNPQNHQPKNNSENQIKNMLGMNTKHQQESNPNKIEAIEETKSIMKEEPKEKKQRKSEPMETLPLSDFEREIHQLMKSNDPKEEKLTGNENGKEKKSKGKNNQYDENNKPSLMIITKFREFYASKRVFYSLYAELQEAWEKVYSSYNDFHGTYNHCSSYLRINRIQSRSVFLSLLFLNLIEKELYEFGYDLFKKNKQILQQDGNFRDIMSFALNILERMNLRNIEPYKKTPINGCISLGELGVGKNNVHLINMYENRRGVPFIPVFEHFKTHSFFTVTYEMNEFDQDYISTIQIATEEDIVIVDLVSLCRNDKVLEIIIDFLVEFFGRSLNRIVVIDSAKFIRLLIDSLFYDKEKESKEIVSKVTDLCRVFDKRRQNLIDLSLLGYSSIRDIAEKVMNMKIDQRSKYGLWYKRPLDNDLVNLAAIHSKILTLGYKKILEWQNIA